MTSPVQTFSPEIFHNYDKLMDFFSGDRELRYLSSLSPSDYIHPKNHELYMSRWRIAWIIVTTPFRAIAWLILHAVARVAWALSCGGCSLSTRLFKWSKASLNETYHLVKLVSHGNRLHSPTRNGHAASDSDVYLSKPFEVLSISDPRASELFTKKVQKNVEVMGESYPFEISFVPLKTISFHHPKGICRGASKWFGYIFHHCLHLLGTKFSTTDDYLAAITSLFRNGSTKQAAILQGLPLIENKILDLPDEPTELSPDSLTSSNMETVKYWKNLQDGYYQMSLSECWSGESRNAIEYIKWCWSGGSGHAIGYIQWKGSRYVFDINSGLIRIDTTTQLIDLFKYYSPKSITIRLLTPKASQDTALTG